MPKLHRKDEQDKIVKNGINGLMQNLPEKWRAVILAVAGLTGIVLLAAVLGGFTFATPYQLLRDESTDTTGLISYTVILRVIVLLLVLVPPVVYLLARSPKHRRWMFLAMVLMFLLIFRIISSRPVTLTPDPEAVGGAIVIPLPETEGDGTPQPTLAPAPDPGTARVTPALVWILSLGLAGMILAAVVILYFSFRTSRSDSLSPLEMIVASAETALQTMEQGGDVRDAVMRCYLEMLSAASELGVERPGYLTPAEFVQRLVRAGLPLGAVERLTHLFEEVRYSPQSPSPVMEVEAVACLRTVVQAARGGA